MSRPTCCVRIDEREAGRELVRRIRPLVDGARLSQQSRRATPRSRWHSPIAGLKALGVPPASLDSFAAEFRQGMAARAAELGDVGDSSPTEWEISTGKLRGPRGHCRALARRSTVGGRAGAGPPHLSRSCRGVEVIWRQDCYQLPTGRTSFGFKDGIGQPAIEGSGVAGSQSAGATDQSRRVHPRLPGRDRRSSRRSRRRTCWVGTARTSRFATPHTGGGLPAIRSGQRRQPAGGVAAWGRRS